MNVKFSNIDLPGRLHTDDPYFLGWSHFFLNHYSDKHVFHFLTSESAAGKWIINSSENERKDLLNVPPMQPMERTNLNESDGEDGDDDFNEDVLRDDMFGHWVEDNENIGNVENQQVLRRAIRQSRRQGEESDTE